MEPFFIIGAGDPSFLCTSVAILSLPTCQGIVTADGKEFKSRYLPALASQEMSKIKTISLIDFIHHAKKHPGTALVSYYDFPAGRFFLEKLRKNFNHFQIYDHYNFLLEHNVTSLFTPAEDERQAILSGEKEWAELRRNLTDDFSVLSLDLYLETCKQKKRSLLFPVCIGLDNIFFNRISRKASFVPGPQEKYVDVGATDGDTVINFVDAAGTYSSIEAFEPILQLYKGLEKRKFYLDNFISHHAAASNFKGEIEFCAFGLKSHILEERAHNNVGDREVCRCVKLDDVIEDATLLKIEVEGHEAAVIEGAENLIRKCKPDMVVGAYHYALDPIKILHAVQKAHNYKHIALRFYTTDTYIFSLLFSDRAPFE